MIRDIGVEVSSDLSQKKENKERIRKIHVSVCALVDLVALLMTKVS